MVDKNINHLIEKMVFTEGLSDSEKVKSRLKKKKAARRKKKDKNEDKLR